MLSDTGRQSLTTGNHRQPALDVPRLPGFTAPGSMRQYETGNADTGRCSPYFHSFQYLAGEYQFVIRLLHPSQTERHYSAPAPCSAESTSFLS